MANLAAELGEFFTRLETYVDARVREGIAERDQRQKPEKMRKEVDREPSRAAKIAAADSLQALLRKAGQP